MFTLVHAFVAPTGNAEQSADVGAGLPSDSVDAPRVIKATQVQRLMRPPHTSGRVPLQVASLLSECITCTQEWPGPQVSDTTDLILPDEWIKQGGDDAATDDVMERYTKMRDELEVRAAASAQATHLDRLMSHATARWTHARSMVGHDLTTVDA